MILGLLEFIKTYVLFMNQKDEKRKVKSLKTVINFCVIILIITFIPQLKKIINKITNSNS